MTINTFEAILYLRFHETEFNVAKTAVIFSAHCFSSSHQSLPLKLWQLRIALNKPLPSASTDDHHTEEDQQHPQCDLELVSIWSGLKHIDGICPMSEKIDVVPLP